MVLAYLAVIVVKLISHSKLDTMVRNMPLKVKRSLAQVLHTSKLISRIRSRICLSSRNTVYQKSFRRQVQFVLSGLCALTPINKLTQTMSNIFMAIIEIKSIFHKHNKRYTLRLSSAVLLSHSLSWSLVTAATEAATLSLFVVPYYVIKSCHVCPPCVCHCVSE